MTDHERRRLRRSALLHGFAVAVFALLALSGVGAATQGAYGLAAAFLITGAAGATGAAVITAAVWRAVSPGGAVAGGAPQRTVRLTMVVAAGVAVAAGVLLAPQGMDRGFVISVAALLAAALALFALLAGDRSRTAAEPGSR